MKIRFNAAHLQAWIHAGGILLSGGVLAIAEVGDLLTQIYGKALSEDQLNEILAGVRQDATQRKARAEAESKPPAA